MAKPAWMKCLRRPESSLPATTNPASPKSDMGYAYAGYSLCVIASGNTFDRQETGQRRLEMIWDIDLVDP